MERTDVAVVGAGVIGSAAARALAARGVPVLLLEQFSLGHDRGSSHGATRIFRLSYPEPDYVRLAVTAREAWARLQDDAAEELLLTTGGLDAGPDAARCAAALAACGVPHSWLGAGEIGERFPGIAARPGERMLFQADAGVLLAGRALAALHRLARRDGADIRAQTPVSAVQPRGDHAVLRTPAGEISARAVVIAAGGWCAGLLDAAWARRLTATVQQVSYFTPRPSGTRLPTLIEWVPAGPAWYAVPVVKGEGEVGGPPGVKVGAHAPGRAVDPRTGPFPGIDPALADEAARYVRGRLPGVDPAGLAAETCLYTMTPDEDFVVDREGPVVVGGGGSGHAFKFGPLLGEMLASLALGEDTGVPRRRFAFSRPALAG